MHAGKEVGFQWTVLKSERSTIPSVIEYLNAEGNIVYTRDRPGLWCRIAI